MAAGKRKGGGRRRWRGAALAGRERAGDGGGSGASLPPSGSHSNRPLRMTLQAGPALRKRGGLRAQRRKGGAGRRAPGGAVSGEARGRARGAAGNGRSAEQRPQGLALGQGRAAGADPSDRRREAAPAVGSPRTTVVSREKA